MDDESESVLLRYPVVNKNLLIELEQWKWNVVKRSAENDCLNGFMWALLLSSADSIITKKLKLEFPDIGKANFVSALYVAMFEVIGKLFDKRNLCFIFFVFLTLFVQCLIWFSVCACFSDDASLTMFARMVKSHKIIANPLPFDNRFDGNLALHLQSPNADYNAVDKSVLTFFYHGRVFLCSQKNFAQFDCC